ncbi:pentapeptide repeat-containing protein [Amycolatopsis sp. OK19-0408]|uniref:Pentapeptide repeat-containing protein n=1 Tax=Amycolatopsis iheyensis TaxID=2945988 RepID=A0A9X2SJB4_9PSEU|nr:pentapeptide repeat-containing protein [Amycolatopsis iheyensis]MCR6483848.1 pentapeptide repeat-containing protein [Amycolatopsis iheyensis]
MSTLAPFPVLALVAAVSGAVTAWLLARRARPAEVSPAPGFAGSETERKTYAEERATRLAGLREFAELADRDPSARQDFVDRLFVELEHGWRETGTWPAELWPLLLARLRPASPRFWPEIDLHPRSVSLIGADLRGCVVRNAIFHDVYFFGDARFDGAVCTGLASFRGCRFARHAYFRGTRFETGADFGTTTFTGTAAFTGARTDGETWFDGARFSARTDFDEIRFADTSFAGAGFAGRTSFRDARFDEAFFGGARFGGHADFTGAAAERFRFAGASARTDVHLRRKWPMGWSLGPVRACRPGEWAEVRAGQ